MRRPPTDARTYLSNFLAAHGVNLKAASLAIGRNHAYLQQFIRVGKPQWLNEPDREALVRLYGVDAGKLKPQALQANRPFPGSRDPRTLDLLEIWSNIPRDRRDLALKFLRAFTS